MSQPTEPRDRGLLSPVAVGTAAESLTSDDAVVDAMVRFETALLQALSPSAGAPATDLDVRALARDAVRPGNPTIPLVSALRGTLPDEVAESLHHGATSQDVVDTALVLVATDVLQRLDQDLTAVAGRLGSLADEHRSTPCVARTLTQQAMPTTLGFRVADWLAGVHDAIDLVRAALPLPLSLGGPVGTAAAWGDRGPDVVAAVAHSLGLAAPVVGWHARRTVLVPLVAALAAAGEACGRIAADVLLMSQTEVGEADDGSAGTSSAMAHKANPVRSVLVSSAARQLPGLVATVLGSGIGASERPAGDWHAEWQPLRTMLRLSGAAAERLTDVVADLSFDTDALERNLELLLDATGHDQAWVSEQTAHVGVWVDRVLARQQELS